MQYVYIYELHAYYLEPDIERVLRHTKCYSVSNTEVVEVSNPQSSGLQEAEVCFLFSSVYCPPLFGVVLYGKDCV